MSESDAHVPWYVVMDIFKEPATGSPPSRPELIPELLNATCLASRAMKHFFLPLSLDVVNEEFWSVVRMRHAVHLGDVGQ